MIEPEQHTKILLPTMDEFLNFQDCKVAKTCRYYSMLERVFELEWYVRSLNFTPEQAIEFDSKIEAGIPFWDGSSFEERE